MTDRYSCATDCGHRRFETTTQPPLAGMVFCFVCSTYVGVIVHLRSATDGAGGICGRHGLYDGLRCPACVNADLGHSDPGDEA